MKLVHYTNRSLFILLFFLMGAWGLLFYFTIIDEVMDETDDTLENYREIVVGKILDDPEILETEDRILHSYTIRPLDIGEALDYEVQFYDSEIYIATEDEHEPVRVMRSCFLAPDDQFYELTLRISTVERDDMVRAIFWYLLVLYIVMLLCVTAGTRVVLKRVFVPLQRLLTWFDHVVPGKPVPPLDNETKIAEFSKLNKAAVAMSFRSQKAYEEQKQFIENASHELQTPLAIARGKLELLAESEGLSEKHLQDIDELYRTLGRAVKLNKSLLLLSRIDNGQYPDSRMLDLGAIAKETLCNLLDIYESRQIKASVEERDVCRAEMNDSLAHVLLTNLLKNAIVHNNPGGELRLVLGKNEMKVCNTGVSPLDAGKIFRRFYRADLSKKESTGLGLAIAKSICGLYGIRLSYMYEQGMHCFVLNFVNTQN